MEEVIEETGQSETVLQRYVKSRDCVASVTDSNEAVIELPLTVLCTCNHGVIFGN